MPSNLFHSRPSLPRQLVAWLRSGVTVAAGRTPYDIDHVHPVAEIRAACENDPDLILEPPEVQRRVYRQLLSDYTNLRPRCRRENRAEGPVIGSAPTGGDSNLREQASDEMIRRHGEAARSYWVF